ncbi:MAG: hypothetical protein ABI846_02985 [Rudaea sp.]
MRTLLLLVLAVFASACARTPDEEKIRETIAAMKQAMERGSPRDFIDHVSVDFKGDHGDVDRNRLANILRVQVLRNERLNVLLGPIDVEVQGDRATAQLTATLAGRDAGAVPERVSIFAITSSWRRAGSAWECYNAQWEQKL